MEADKGLRCGPAADLGRNGKVVGGAGRLLLRPVVVVGGSSRFAATEGIN